MTRCFEQCNIHLFSVYLLYTCYVSDTVKGAGETAVNRKDNSSCHGADIQDGVKGAEKENIQKVVCVGDYNYEITIMKL